MARAKLTPAFVERNAKKPGMYGDGGGLYLQVTSKNGACSWIYRYMMRGRAREMGLGSFPEVSLPAARDAAEEGRKLKAAGVDPIEERERLEAARRDNAGKAKTFKQCAESCIAARKPSWKNAKHAAQWTSTLKTYAYPTLGNLAVSEIDVGLVHRVLEPIWSAKPETARRVRGRIETVLDYAAALKYRDNNNPARWKGQLENLFPKRSKRNIRHHAALPYAEMGAFMAALEDQSGIGAEALEFTILTAARTNETMFCEWPEIDFDRALWTVPAARMKATRDHRVPLSKAALAVLKKRYGQSSGKDYVFPGMKPRRPISNMTMAKVLKDMGRHDITVHGFRSSFRDWVEEETSFPGSVAEAALAHIVGDETEAAYRRGDLFEKRRKLMDAWARFCTTPAKGANVIPMKRRADTP